jgi:hypothetical protein
MQVSIHGRVAIAAIVAAAACHHSAAVPDAATPFYLCVQGKADGSCVSMPAYCPLFAHPTTPRCPSGFSLESTTADDCATKLLCID